MLAGTVTLWQSCQHRAGSTARSLLEGEYCQMTASPRDVPAARQLPSELHDRAVTLLWLSPAVNLGPVTMADLLHGSHVLLVAPTSPAAEGESSSMVACAYTMQ